MAPFVSEWLELIQPASVQNHAGKASHDRHKDGCRHVATRVDIVQKQSAVLYTRRLAFGLRSGLCIPDHDNATSVSMCAF